MNPLHRIAFACTLLTAIGLGACTTAMDPSQMVAVDAAARVRLATPFAYTAEMGGVCTVHVRYTLAPGTYVARLKNAEGTFFEGPAGALQTRLLDNSCNKVPDNYGLTIDAGVFVPNKPSEPAKIFYTQPQHGNYDFTVTTVSFGTDEHGQKSTIDGVAVTTNSTAAGAGAGAAIGGGIVNGFIVADRGKIRFLAGQTTTALNQALVRE